MKIRILAVLTLASSWMFGQKIILDQPKNNAPSDIISSVNKNNKGIYVADDLLSEQATVAVYDPKVGEEQIQFDLNYLETRSESENQKGVQVMTNAYDACKNAHAIAVLTEWDEFKTQDWQKIYDNMLKPAFVFDGRNILNKEELEKIGFIYQGIGAR